MAADKEVRYKLTLSDLLSGGIRNANEHAEVLEGTMGRVEKIAGALGVAFGVYEGWEYVKGATEAFHNLEQANAQVKAGIESTHGAAGLTFTELEENAEALTHHLKYTQTQISGMQSVLLTFPAVTKATFSQASEAILNMSTRLKTDAESTSLQVGKALQDPILGMTALHRAGVNFSEQQKALVKDYVAHGNMIAAQTLILKELNTEFAGSAQAAFDADPAARYTKTLEEAKLEMGQLGEEVVTATAPAMQVLANDFKDGIQWIREHKGLIKDLGEVLVIATGAYVAYNAGVAVSIGLTKIKTAYTWAMNVAELAAATGEGYLTTAQWALNGAMDANPIGAVVALCVAWVGVLYDTYKHTDMLTTALLIMAGPVLGTVIWGITKATGGFGKLKAMVHGTAAVILNFGHTIATVFNGVMDVVDGVLSGDKKMISTGWDEIANKNGKSAAEAFKASYDGVMATDAEKARKEKVVAKPVPGIKGADGAPSIPAPSKAGGTKSVTVNISIGKMIETFKISTTNLHEGINKAAELVSNGLLAAVNDGQLVGDI